MFKTNISRHNKTWGAQKLGDTAHEWPCGYGPANTAVF